MTYGGVTCLHDRDAVERNIGALTSAWHSLNRRPHQIDLALKRAKRPKYQWLDFANVSPFFLWKQGLEMILSIPLVLLNSIHCTDF